MTTYYSNMGFDTASVFDEIDKIDGEYEDLKEKGEITDEDIFKLNYRRMIQTMKLNTGYVRLY